MRVISLTAAAIAGLLLGSCAYDNDRYDGGRYRYGGYSAGDRDGRYAGRGRYPGYSAGDSNTSRALSRRGSFCDDGAEVCYKNGSPDVSDTRDRFGRDAARRVD